MMPCTTVATAPCRWGRPAFERRRDRSSEKGTIPIPKALRTHIFKVLGPKTMSCRALGLFQALGFSKKPISRYTGRRRLAD